MTAVGYLSPRLLDEDIGAEAAGHRLSGRDYLGRLSASVNMCRTVEDERQRKEEKKESGQANLS